MSKRRSSPVPRLLIGLAVGAMAIAVYRRRASLQALYGSRSGAALPSGSRAMTPSGGSPMQNVLAATTDVARQLSTLTQGGPNGLVEQARRYVASARAQLDVAIAEGQATAAQTRRELEERFAAAKTDPRTARSAFR